MLLCPGCWHDVSEMSGACPEPRCALPRPAWGWTRLPIEFEAVYTFEERIGCGALGAVFRARRLRDGATHAVKVPRRFRAGGEGVYARVAEAEQVGVARAVQAARSRGMEMCFVEWRAIEAGYIAMEYIDLPTLDAVLATRCLSPSEGANLGASLCAALEILDALRMVHCDLKPSNMFVRPSDWHVVVGDLGAWVPEREPTRLGAGAAGVGHPFYTPRYASPEQMRGETLTVRSDVHAAGSIIWEAVVGTVPYPHPLEERRVAAESLPARPSALPVGLYEILLEALAPVAADRPRAAALRARLEAFAGERGERAAAEAWREEIAARDRGIAARDERIAGLEARLDELGQEGEEQRARSRRTLGVALACVSLVGAAGWGLALWPAREVPEAEVIAAPAVPAEASAPPIEATAPVEPSVPRRSASGAAAKKERTSTGRVELWECGTMRVTRADGERRVVTHEGVWLEAGAYEGWTGAGLEAGIVRVSGERTCRFTIVSGKTTDVFCSDGRDCTASVR